MTAAPSAPELARAADWLRNSRHLLITAGAGLTAAAGIDYGDTELFAREFPAMLRYGVRAQYQMIGRSVADPAVLWGYWAAHVNLVRWHSVPSEAYRLTKHLAGGFADDDTFVFTSNVDAMFERHGFDPAHIYTPQGDYALLQCRLPCTRAVWEWKPELDAIVAATDPATQRTDPDLVPRCPNCGGEVFLNVRIDASFIGDHFQPAAERLERWIDARRDDAVTVLEMGAGFNTPSVVRWPSEQLVRSFPRWHLIRVNLMYPSVPDDLDDRAASVGGSATTVLRQLVDRVGTTSIDDDHS